MMDEILQGDSLEILKTLDSESVQTCVTSPPYFGLRDYGVDGQIGLEETPDAYVAKLVEVFREVRRVLKNDGTLWLNLGDSYATHASKRSGQFGKGIIKGFDDIATTDFKAKAAKRAGLKEKDLIGIPWRVAFALQADGWYLRQDIIWSKLNPMPESVTDRCTKAHEYIFLLSKSSSYYFDNEAIKEPFQSSGKDVARQKTGIFKETAYATSKQWSGGVGYGDGGRNKRSVWTVATKPYKDAHFATFPEELIQPCIMAGAPEGGVVLDPFMGAGTTAVVAHKLNRKWLGIELNPDYAKLAQERVGGLPVNLFAHT